MEISFGLRRLFVSLLVAVLYQNGGLDALGGDLVTIAGRVNFTAAVNCEAPLSCETTPDQGQTTPTTPDPPPEYHYDAVDHSCRPVPPGCHAPPGGSFPDPSLCLAACRSLGGCVSTKQGCCPDNQTPRSPGQACPGEEEQSSGGNTASGSNTAPSSIRWDFIASGLLGVMLLMSTVAVAGIVSYSYRRRKRQRQRSRYIQEVLQLYNESSSSGGEDSDSSYMADNPESHNLFDQL